LAAPFLLLRTAVPTLLIPTPPPQPHTGLSVPHLPEPGVHRELPMSGRCGGHLPEEALRFCCSVADPDRARHPPRGGEPHYVHPATAP
jgi:hypothetical protein